MLPEAQAAVLDSLPSSLPASAALPRGLPHFPRERKEALLVCGMRLLCQFPSFLRPGVSQLEESGLIRGIFESPILVG